MKVEKECVFCGVCMVEVEEKATHPICEECVRDFTRRGELVPEIATREEE